MTMLHRFVWACSLLSLTIVTKGAEPDSGNDHPVNRWVLQSPREGRPAPNFPYEGSGDYDPYLKRWIHHAGHDGIPQGFHTFTMDLENGQWRQHFPPTSPPGVCCVDGSNVFDLAQRRFVRFPGGSLGHGFQWSRGVKLKESPVWLYDSVENSWTNMRPPPYNLGEHPQVAVGGLNSTATYDANHEITFSFGGQGSSGGKNALFAYDAYANALHYLDAANSPPARDGLGLAYDRRRDKLILFGGQYLVDGRTWFYDPKTNRWEGKQLDPHPPAHKVTKDYTSIPRLAYDAVNDVVLCLAWMGETGHETWVLDPEKLAWQKLEPSAEPSGSKSRSRNLSFDPEQNRFILELSSAKTNRPEIWTYRYRESDPKQRPLAPPTDLQLTTSSADAQLRWLPSTSRDVKAYHIYRAQADEPWRAALVKIGEVAGDTAMYLDKDLKPAQIYYYAVKAIGNARESGFSFRVRTQPRVLAAPLVSVLGQDRIQVQWPAHADRDVVGYNLYRGLANVATVKKGEPKAWRDNDPEYVHPQVVKVKDITRIERLNEKPLSVTTFEDQLDLKRKPLPDEYALGVYAYIVRSVNAMGVESGPSPYALTLPSEPKNVFCREQGQVAELKWDANPETGIAGYHVYRLKGTWEIERLTEQPVRETPSSPAWFNHSFQGFYEGPWHQ